MEFSYDDDLIAFRDELRAFIAEHRTPALMEEVREARRRCSPPCASGA